MSGVRNLKLEVILAAIDKATRPIKAVMQSSKGLAAAVKESRDRLKELNAQQGKIDAFRQLTRDAKETGDKLAAARQKMRELSAQMTASGPPTQQMARQMQRAEIAVEKLTLANRKKIDAAKAARTALDAAGISAGRLASHEAQLRNQISAANQALTQQEAKLAASNRRMQQMAATRAKYDKGMATRDKMAGAGASMMGAGAATGAAVLMPVREFAQAEDSAVQLKVAMMGAGGVVQKEFGAVNALAEKLGNELPGTTSEFQDMMRVLIQKGLDAKVVLGGAGEATAKLAVLTKVSFEESANAISVFQDSMGVADKDMVSAADQMQRLYHVGMKISDIQEGFKAMGPSLTYLRKGGLDAVKALGPLLAITDAAGMDAGSAGNAYNKIIRGSVDEKKVGKANAVLKAQGIKLNFVDAKGNFAGVDNMVNQIMKIQGLSDQKRKTVIETVFGSDKEVAEALNALSKAGNPGIEAMRKKLADQASLQERVGAQLGTLKNLWDASTGAFTGAVVKFGEAISPEVKALTVGIGDLSEKLANWAKENPGLANGLMKLAGTIAIVLTVMGSLTLAAAAVFGPMLIAKAGFAMLGIQLTSGVGILGAVGSALASVGRAMLWVGRIFLLNPIGLAITAIAAGAYLIWRNWDSIGPKFAALWDGIKSVVGAVGGWIMNYLMNWTIVGFVADHWEDIRAISMAIWDRIKSGVAAAADGIVSLFMNWTLVGVMVRNWDTIRAGAGAAWQWIKDMAVSAGQGITNFFMNWTLFGVIVRNWDSITTFMQGLVGRFFTIGGQIMDGLVNGIVGSTMAVKNAINGAGESVIGWFKEKLGIHSPSRVFAELGGFTMDGLSLGIEGGQGGPLGAIMSVAKKLTAAGAGLTLGVGSAVAGTVPLDTRPPVSAPHAAPAASTSNQFIFQIHPSPGMDEKQLAQLVVREVERIQRQAEARSRSSMKDRD